MNFLKNLWFLFTAGFLDAGHGLREDQCHRDECGSVNPDDYWNRLRDQYSCDCMKPSAMPTVDESELREATGKSKDSYP